MTRYAAVVFDLDGTLVDSAPDLHAAANRMLAELGRPSLTLREITGFIGNGVPKLVERCLRATGGSDGLHADALARFRRHYDQAPADLTRPYPGALEAAVALRGAGCRLGICTNKPEAPARKLLDLLGMAAPFAAVVGGDTVAALKPDPAPLRRCLALLEADATTTLYVGDSETDAATAAAAGIPFALFAGGYRKAAIEDLGPLFHFSDFAALREFVLAPAA